MNKDCDKIKEIEQIIREKLILPNLLAGSSYETETKNLNQTAKEIIKRMNIK